MDRAQLLRIAAHRRRITQLYLVLGKYGDALSPEAKRQAEQAIATTERWIKLLEAGLDP